MRALTLLILLVLTGCDDSVSPPRLPPPEPHTTPTPPDVVTSFFVRAVDHAGREVSACDLQLEERELGRIQVQACWTVDKPMRMCSAAGTGCTTLGTANFAVRFPVEMADIRYNPRSITVLDAAGNRIGAPAIAYFIPDADTNRTNHVFLTVAR